MKKSIFLFSILGLSTAIVGIYATSTIGDFNVAKAEHVHNGNHYSYLAPTASTAGHKEFWACCGCHEAFIEEPEGNFLNVSEALLQVEVEESHIAYLPATSAVDSFYITLDCSEGGAFDKNNTKKYKTIYGDKNDTLGHILEANPYVFCFTKWYQQFDHWNYLDGKPMDRYDKLDRNIHLVADYENKPLDFFSWTEIKTMSDDIRENGTASEYIDVLKIGDTKQTLVNGQYHTVALIDILHDDDATGGKASFTFQFRNVICDSFGNSIATPYYYDFNCTYADSYLRQALNGDSMTMYDHWYKKGDSTTANLYNCVLNMLEPSLTSAIAQVEKDFWDGKNVSKMNCKLFDLSVTEMNADSYDFDTPLGSLYSYYNTDRSDLKRMEVTQINLDSEYTQTPKVEDLDENPANYAGFVAPEINTTGYWTRTPFDSKLLMHVSVDYSGFYYSSFATKVCLPTAPGFCI